nr:flavin reductase family protein [Kibdelosporangium phytohabitans]
MHPQGVTIVTTHDEYGNQWGMTATSVTSVSLDPPLVLLCVTNRSGLIGPMTAGAGFNVHFLAADQAELATRFATPLADKFTGASYEFTPTGGTKLDGALACLECVADSTYQGGDHTIIVGRIVDLSISSHADRALVFFDGVMTPVGTNGKDL